MPGAANPCSVLTSGAALLRSLSEMQSLRPSPDPLILPRTLTRSPGTHGRVEDGQGQAPSCDQSEKALPAPLRDTAHLLPTRQGTPERRPGVTAGSASLSSAPPVPTESHLSLHGAAPRTRAAGVPASPSVSRTLPPFQ